jgi:hypothetical protein
MGREFSLFAYMAKGRIPTARANNAVWPRGITRSNSLEVCILEALYHDIFCILKL